MIQKAERLHSVTEYYFSKKLREVDASRKEGKEIINMAIGSPDLPPPDAVIKALNETTNTKGAHQYQSYQGIPELREAIANFYLKHYRVSLNPYQEILPLMGSKEGIMHISMAFLNKGDSVLIPAPGYPSYASVSKLMQAKGFSPNSEELAKEMKITKEEFDELLSCELRSITVSLQGTVKSKSDPSELVDILPSDQIPPME